MAPARNQQALFAGILITIALLVLLHRNREEVQGRLSHAYSKIVIPGNAIPEEALHNTVSESYISEYAHRFQTPDEYKKHFGIVKNLPPLSISEAKRTCTWTSDDFDGMQFMWGPESAWMKNEFTPDETEEKRAEWMRFFERDLIPYESVKHKFKGRGIVTTAGNVNTLKRLGVTLRQLRRLKSTLPVEVHYWRDEVSPAQMKHYEAMYPNMYWNDLSDPKTNFFMTHEPAQDYGHFNLKTAAAMNSRFAEMLLLDTDCLPVTLPETLFETDTYKEFGTIFWPDIGRTRPENPIWAITRTFCKMDEYEQESGQMLLNKARLFYHLHLASWFNEQKYYEKLILGDKDMFRFAWHALKTQYGRPGRWMASIGINHHGRYCGHSFGQRHPNGGVAFMHRGLFKLHHTESLRYFRDYGGGIYNAYKASKYDNDLTYPEPTKWTFDYVEGLKDSRGWSCMDLPEVEPRPLDELIPGFEQVWRDIDGYWMIDDPDED